MSGTAHFKSLGLRVKSAGAPDEAQLAKIHAYTLVDLPPEKLYARTFVVAHNAIDRDNEVFGSDVLTAFAQTLPGKGLHIKHPLGWDGDTGPGKGRWFDAQVERMSHDEARKLLRAPDLQWPPGEADAALLMGSAFLAVTSGNADLRDEIDAGIAGDVSIGFNAKWPTPIVDADGHELTTRKWSLPAEALEGSLVWLGAQPGARAVKAAKTNPENTNVTLEEQLKAANTRIGELESQLSESQKTANRMTAARKAVGDDAHLLESDDTLVETVAAAKAHRQSLIDDIVAGERAVGLCGDDDEAVKAASAIYAGEKLPRLESLAKHWRERTPTGSKVAPSDPNANKNKGAATDAFSTNPAFGGKAVATA
ncbi:MAG: hypothetical protein ACREPV_01135 [Lysobacter sp.]